MSTPPSSSSELPRGAEPRLLPLPGGDAAVGQPYSVVDPWVIGTAGVIVLAFALRLAAADQQSAYMDEGTNILTGRLLIE